VAIQNQQPSVQHCRRPLLKGSLRGQVAIVAAMYFVSSMKQCALGHAQHGQGQAHAMSSDALKMTAGSHRLGKLQNSVLFQLNMHSNRDCSQLNTPLWAYRAMPIWLARTSRSSFTSTLPRRDSRS
jgi:hypothetical protein